MSQVRCKLLDGIRDHQRPAHLLSWDAEFLCWLSGCDVSFTYITACLDQYSVLLGQQSLFTSTEPVLLKTTVKDRWYILKLECKVTSWYGIKDHWNNWTNHTLEGCWDARLFQYFWKFEKVLPSKWLWNVELSSYHSQLWWASCFCLTPFQSLLAGIIKVYQLLQLRYNDSRTKCKETSYNWTLSVWACADALNLMTKPHQCFNTSDDW